MIHLLHVLKQISSLFKQCDGLLITAGAGMGVDSGLPDFRGKEGFWKVYPHLKDKKIHFQDIANPAGFRQNPSLAWGFYGHRHALYKQTIPHEGFQILKKLITKFANGGFVVTSNVDGHFQKSGFNEERIYELHGNINFSQCSEPCTLDICATPSVSVNDQCLSETIPSCHICGEHLRPNILMFNDGAWISSKYDKQEVEFNKWLKGCKKVMCIEIGAGVNIQSIRMISEEFHRTLIRINPRDFITPYHNGISIPLTGLLGLQLIEYVVNNFED